MFRPLNPELQISWYYFIVNFENVILFYLNTRKMKPLYYYDH